MNTPHPKTERITASANPITELRQRTAIMEARIESVLDLAMSGAPGGEDLKNALVAARDSVLLVGEQASVLSREVH